MKRTIPLFLLLELFFGFARQPLAGGPASATVLGEEPFITLVPGSRWIYEQAAFVEEGYWEREALFCAGPRDLGKGVTAVLIKAEKRHLAYWVQENTDGLFILRTRRPLSFLGHITATFDPPMKVVQLPMKEGDRWAYDGKAKTWIKNTHLHIDFVNRGAQLYKVGDRMIQAYKIESKIQFGKIRPYFQISWYGEKVGYLGGERIGKEKTRIVDFTLKGLADPVDLK